MNIKKKLKKKAFKKAHEVLPKEKVREIQKKRLEGGLSVKHVPSSYTAAHTYSVISAVYNVEKYLDDFFANMVTQTIKLDNLKLIMVDDGSTDNSANIIKSWAESFPASITYIHKENGGQSSARNLGLAHAKTEWVTFVDPDDYVSQQYFEEIDKAIKAQPDICFATCRIIFNNEAKGEFFDKHPLRDEFKKEVSLYSITDDFMPITLSASKSFFKFSNIEDFEIRFDERVKPDFEDAHFLNKYLLAQKKGLVAYLRKPVYYYRKREAGTSTLDGAWSNPDKYSTVLTKGKLDLLEYARKTKGYIPSYIQRTVLYDLSWYFKYLVGHDEKISTLPEGLSDKFWKALEAIFRYIDDKTILECKWLRFEFKNALLRTFKNSVPNSHYTYLQRVDYTAKTMLIKCCTDDIDFYANGEKLNPIQTKQICRKMFGQTFYSIWMKWIPLPDENATLSYSWGSTNKYVHLNVRGKTFSNAVQMKQLNTQFKTGWEKYKQDPAAIWLFMDRDTQADDNAEHLYRWVIANHPEQKCYFVLRKEAPDWKRLSNEGFSLVSFGSKEHETALKTCSTIISSHTDAYVHSYFKDNFLRSKRFVFLQHGTVKDDLSNWLNGKPIDLMLTTSPNEYESIAANGTNYDLTPRQILLSGLPRHDALLAQKARKKTILIMPTWRKALCGKVIGKGNARELNPEFNDSLYKKSWEDFLNAPELHDIALKTECDIMFFPHANTYPYLENGTFSIPSYIETLGNKTGNSIQKAFADAAILITDYSSVAFETAYLKKPCIYYQFDADEFFSGSHIATKGYFEYARDGFGPVVATEDELISELKAYADRSFAPEEKYAKRMEEFFPFRDGKCCERVYDRIQELADGKF